MKKETIKSAFESMLFVWGDPLEARLAAEVFDIDVKLACEYFRELQAEYEQQGRGIMIQEADKSFQLCTRPENSEFVERLCTPVKEKRLSQSAMEVLAIVAYKQPVTKGEIESIRGIKCDRVIEGLAKKGLIEEVGRSSGIGRPILYGTTKVFLKNFGFRTLRELPDIEDIDSVIRAEEGEEDSPDFQQIAIQFEGEEGTAETPE
ncbi:MAG: SMC-Scp complex subunit ScpB [Bacillota bacterium]|nr:SMC-Scp complex subunit ScpB [Bacillota bacterium]